MSTSKYDDGSGSTFLSKGPCDACGSSDANATYSDGHTHCFSCEAHVHGDGTAPPSVTPAKPPSGLITGEIRGLRTRKITDATCQHFGYMVGTYKRKTVQIAPYVDADGHLVAQHLRTADKDFPWLGDSKAAMPFGYHAFQKSGKMLTLCEGEIDALSMSQVQDNKWPVWAIGCGAGQGEATKVRRYIAKHRNALLKFEKVVLMFDMDEQGRDSAKAAAEVLGPTAHIATLPLHDVNDMLKAGRVKELLDAMWRATPYRPDGIVTLDDVADSILEGFPEGKSFAFPSLTKLTYGRRLGEVWVIGAGTGTGKTDFLVEEIAYAIKEHNEKVGLFFLEATPKEIGTRLAGKIASKPFHVPDGSWTEDERKLAVESIRKLPVFLYDSYGMSDWDIIKEHVRYLAHAHDVKYFILDNLTSFATGAEDERRELERVMGEAAGLMQELQGFMWIVSHLNTPDGLPHENGGKIQLRHLKGTRGIAAWANGAIGLERDQQAEDELERCTTTARMLKDRYTGRATGQTFRVRYDFATGRLSEVSDDPGDLTSQEAFPQHETEGGEEEF